MDIVFLHVLPEPAEGAGPGTSRARVRRCARRPPRPGDGSSAVQGRDRGDAAVRPPDAGGSDDGGLGAGNAAQTRGANARLRSSADGGIAAGVAALAREILEVQRRRALPAYAAAAPEYVDPERAGCALAPGVDPAQVRRIARAAVVTPGASSRTLDGPGRGSERPARSTRGAPVLTGTGALTRKLVERVPFKLTRAQERVWREIAHDLKRASP